MATSAPKRLTAVMGILAALSLADSAVAHHLSTGRAKAAILSTLPFRPDAKHCDTTMIEACWRVLTSGKTWATAVDVGSSSGAQEWTYIDHLVGGRWRYVGGQGEGVLFPCRRKGMPPSIARDLHITCSRHSR